MAKVNPHLTYNGNCEEAFKFYKTVFGNDFGTVARFKDMPAISGQELPENLKEKIMHISYPISKETILMGSDANPMMGSVNTGQNLSLTISADTREEADKIFKALSSGGKITLPISDMFWGAYFGMLIDKYDFIWMINYEYPKK